MKAWVFVEGSADVAGLEALWQDWRDRLRAAGHGIQVIALNDKSTFFRKFGYRAAEKLTDSPIDVVVGLPDLYPMSAFAGTRWAHSNLAELANVQAGLVRRGLIDTQGFDEEAAQARLTRLLPSALKHDLEMLLLAAKEELRATLGTPDRLRGWKNPVEDQNDQNPPKRIVEELFRSKTPRKRAYRDTTDAPAVLRRVRNVQTLLRTHSGQLNCPEFARVLGWLADRFGMQC